MTDLESGKYHLFRIDVYHICARFSAELLLATWTPRPCKDVSNANASKYTLLSF